MSTSSKTIPRAVAFAIVVAAITTAAYFMLVNAPPEAANKWYATAKRMVKDVDEMLHIRPRVTTGGITLIKEKNSIKELSTVEKNFDHTYSWKSSWLGSTKRIELKGHFIAKAGYDLAQPFAIDISEDGKTICAVMPPARINSVEQIKMEIIKDENGVWNRISPQEREQALNALLHDAKTSIENSGILDEADHAFMSQLEEAIRKSAPPEVRILREPLS